LKVQNQLLSLLLNNKTQRDPLSRVPFLGLCPKPRQGASGSLHPAIAISCRIHTKKGPEHGSLLLYS